MNEVWILVKESRVNAGHGESADIFVLPSIDCYNRDTLYPAFTSEEKANDYIKEKKPWGAKAIKFEISS